MNLEINGEQTIDNPTADDIREAVLSLDQNPGEGFIILSAAEKTYLQCSGDTTSGFYMEYQENDIDHHYQAIRTDLTSDEIIATLLTYVTGSDDWKSISEWERMTW